ncbi:ABC transporter permease [Shimia sp. MMG029]|uniref:ABC transporter permease n=1 Tax=Shimia sp. MMG029 TaxID=3021978 RepID=UPI0022FEF192|nr:ABC transporter permease subunit [Shimia sp. MMG029]MDA5558259.1 ABC transporter permease subunit [Shimia sp. MMG029]
MFDVIAPYATQLLLGLLLTLKVALGSFVLGLVLAVLCAPLTQSRRNPLRKVLDLYVTVIRGVPELLVIFLIFYGGTIVLTKLSGSYFEVDALTAGIVALGAVAFAYLLEILRAALQSIPVGQREAALVLGLSRRQMFVHVILPQMLQRALPGIGNQWLIVLKESALVSIVGLEELMRKSVIAAGATHHPLTFYLSAACLYVAVSALSSAIFAQAEQRLTPVQR